MNDISFLEVGGISSFVMHMIWLRGLWYCLDAVLYSYDKAKTHDCHVTQLHSSSIVLSFTRIIATQVNLLVQKLIERYFL